VEEQNGEAITQIKKTKEEAFAAIRPIINPLFKNGQLQRVSPSIAFMIVNDILNNRAKQEQFKALARYLTHKLLNKDERSPQTLGSEGTFESCLFLFDE